MDLDSLLDASAPPIAPRTPELAHELRTLVVTADAAAKPRRRRRRLAIVGLVAVGAIGATAATTVAVGPDHWTPWTTPSGHSCTMEFGVGPAGPDGLGGEPNMWPHPIDKARRTREMAEASAFLARFDYASIDQQQAIARFQREESKVIASETAHPAGKPGEPPDGPQPREKGDDLAVMAVGQVVWDRLDAYLTRQGFDMSTTKGSDLYLLTYGSGWNCDGSRG